jgi:hypothetical protein
MSNNVLEQLNNALLDLDMDGAVEVANAIINGDSSATINEAVYAVSDALQVIGRRF